MFGIGGGEFLFIMIVILMFFGSDKIPEIARNLGKGIAQLKNATNEVKSEIHKGMQNNGIDPNALTSGISEEILKAKEGFTKMVNESTDKTGLQNGLDQIRENFATMNTDLNTDNAMKAEVIQPALPSVTEPQQSDTETSENPEGPIKRQS
jgi:sec-independent protein translocase protein TatA